ncbi:MAG TPA: enoyl-CoA hydratase/isomerase family protein [Phycisphaerales bacterium]|nr:enoyl-CoA hydratase/isomerase family protein [Phycisphaerales bacterium]
MNLAELKAAGPIATLSLNRPEQRNALSIDLLEGLHARLDELRAMGEAGNGPRVVILTGAGKSFCAGMDLKQVLGEPGAPLKLLTSLAEATVKIRTLSAVTIAAVNGAAVGGGCGLTTVCDFAVTHADSKMGFPEVDLGVCPAVVAPWLVRKIGAGRARAMLLRGGLMSGREAHAAGLVTECVESREGLDAAVQSLAERLATGGPKALAATKRLLNEIDGSLDMELARRSATVSAEVLAMPGAIAMLRAKMG